MRPVRCQEGRSERGQKLPTTMGCGDRGVEEKWIREQRIEERRVERRVQVREVEEEVKCEVVCVTPAALKRYGGETVDSVTNLSPSYTSAAPHNSAVS